MKHVLRVCAGTQSTAHVRDPNIEACAWERACCPQALGSRVPSIQLHSSTQPHSKRDGDSHCHTDAPSLVMSATFAAQQQQDHSQRPRPLQQVSLQQNACRGIIRSTHSIAIATASQYLCWSRGTEEPLSAACLPGQLNDLHARAAISGLLTHDHSNISVMCSRIRCSIRWHVGLQNTQFGVDHPHGHLIPADKVLGPQARVLHAINLKHTRFRDLHIRMQLHGRSAPMQ